MYELKQKEKNIKLGKKLKTQSYFACEAGG